MRLGAKSSSRSDTSVKKFLMNLSEDEVEKAVITIEKRKISFRFNGWLITVFRTLKFVNRCQPMLPFRKDCPVG